MEFEQWEPVYEEILDAFGYGRAGDERARELLAQLLSGPVYDYSELDWTGQTVAVAGGAPTLATESSIARQADTVVAASIAADRLRADGVSVDCVVTDLDKHPETVEELTEETIPVAVHAHGDNRDLLRTVVPDLSQQYVIPTTQAKPSGVVRNFGGFTDGDRAAFLADAMGASELVFPGWDFDDQSVSPEKSKKLRWAERLLYWLETVREDQFGVLDGRREDIDTSHLPTES